MFEEKKLNHNKYTCQQKVLGTAQKWNIYNDVWLNRKQCRPSVGRVGI